MVALLISLTVAQYPDDKCPPTAQDELNSLRENSKGNTPKETRERVWENMVLLDDANKDDCAAKNMTIDPFWLEIRAKFLREFNLPVDEEALAYYPIFDSFQNITRGPPGAMPSFAAQHRRRYPWRFRRKHFLYRRPYY